MSVKRTKGLYKYHDSKNWWFRYADPVSGKRKAVSLGTDDEGTAVQRARAILSGGLLVAKADEIDREIDQYLIDAQEREKNPMSPDSAKTARYVLKLFVRESKVRWPLEINENKLAVWVRGLRAAGRSQQTLRMYAAYVKTFTRVLHAAGKLKFDPLAKYSLPGEKATGRQNWVRKQIVRQIIGAVKPRVGPHSKPAGIEMAKRAAEDLKFILYAGFHAGLRRKEISMAKVFWFDVDLGLIHAQNMPDEDFTLKDRDNRTIDMTEEFKVFLTEYLRGRKPGEFVLRPKKTKGTWKYRYDFKRMVEGHFRKVGVKCSLHDMRRSFASNLVSAGVPIYTVAKWLGDRVDVVEKSYGYLAPNTGEINKVA
jgi:integrase